MSAPSIRRTLVGAACLALQPLILNALSVPALGYIIRRLGPEPYAQWMTAVSLIAALAVVANPGLRAAFVRGVAAAPDRAADLLAEQLGLRVSLSLVAATLGLGTCAALGYGSEVRSCAAIAAAGLVFTTISTTLGDLLQASHANVSLASVNLAAGLALTAVSVVAAATGAGPMGMAAAYLTGPVLSVVLLWRLAGRVCRVRIRWSPRRCVGLLVSSRHFAAQQLLFAASGQIEGLAAPRLLGMRSFGSFTAGSILANRLGVLPDSLCAAAYPALARSWSSGPAHAARLVRTYLLLALGAGLIVVAGACVVADTLAGLILPTDPATFVQVVHITIWAVPLLGAELVTGYALNAAGKEAEQARLAVPAAGLGLTMSLMLVWCFGLSGACWSLLLRPAIRWVVLAPLAWRTFAPRGIDPGSFEVPQDLRQAA